MTSRSCLTNLVFYNQMTHIVDEGKTVAYQDLVKCLMLIPTFSWRN